jgi:nucleotide-binding universal stress UspA family protein
MVELHALFALAGENAMTFKDILVHQADDSRADERLKFAVSLTAGFEARLTGIYFHGSAAIPDFVVTQVPKRFLEERYKEVQAQTEQHRKDFEAAANSAGILFEFRSTDRDPLNVITLAARFTDVVVTSQPDPDNPALPDRIVESLLFSAGCPMLMVPFIGQYSALAKRIMLAWSGTRESARAAHDALPLLKRADEVIVFSVDTGGDDFGAAAFAAHLARHGVKATPRHTVAKGISVGEAILSAVTDEGAELLVMGAYGHSRMRELVFGGATREIIGAMTCPTLFSH